MADRGASPVSLPDDWPEHPDPILALNRMGSFDWDLDAGVMQMDAQAHEIFDVRPDEYDDRPETLAIRVPPGEARRLDAVVARALNSGQENYGAYFRIRRRDGSLRWTHTQGYIRRDGTGRPTASSASSVTPPRSCARAATGATRPSRRTSAASRPTWSS